MCVYVWVVLCVLTMRQHNVSQGTNAVEINNLVSQEMIQQILRAEGFEDVGQNSFCPLQDSRHGGI